MVRTRGSYTYREEIQNLAAWCDTNNLVLNIRKTKEIIVDFRTTKKIAHSSLTIKDEVVEKAHSYKFLGVTITEDFSWSDNFACIVAKAQQRLYFLRKLRRANLPQKLMVNFYRCTIESILTNCMTAWYGSCTKTAKKSLAAGCKNSTGYCWYINFLAILVLYFHCFSLFQILSGSWFQEWLSINHTFIYPEITFHFLLALNILIRLQHANTEKLNIFYVNMC